MLPSYIFIVDKLSYMLPEYTQTKQTGIDPYVWVSMPVCFACLS